MGSVRNPKSEAAEQFKMGQTFVKKMLCQKRETGSVTPLTYSEGRQPSLSETGHPLLRQKVKEQPDILLAELQERLSLCSCFGHSLCVPTINRSSRRSGLSHKIRTNRR